MKHAAVFLRWLAAGVATLTVGVWLITGAHRGWTQTSVPIEKLDEVTGLTWRDYQKRFRPGVDFLATGLVIAGGLAGLGWTLGRRHPV